MTFAPTCPKASPRATQSTVISRTKKRWSGRLRTAGALLLLLGAVGLGDALLSSQSPTSASDGRLGLAEGLGRATLLLAVGALAFFIGRAWSGSARPQS